MSRRLALFILALVFSPVTFADAAPSVLVQTQTPQRGDLPEHVTAYGSAVPAVDGSMTLSVPIEGRVERILVAPGEAVHAGQPLLEFRISATAESTYRQAVSALAVARVEQARTARLLAQQLATRDQQAQADKAVADAQAALNALERETGGKPQQTLSAPFDGVVHAILVTQGDRVQPGAALISVTHSGGLVVTVGVEPSELRRLHPGQTATLHALTGGGPALNGHLIRIGHALDPRTRLVNADIAVDGEILQGETFRADIDVGRLTGWRVPRDAVLADAQGAYVFQIASGKAHRVNVTLLGSDGGTSAVEGPIDPQLPLVTLGNYQLSDGAAVRLGDATP